VANFRFSAKADCVDAVIAAEWALLFVRIMSGYGMTAVGAKRSFATSSTFG